MHTLLLYTESGPGEHRWSYWSCYSESGFGAHCCHTVLIQGQGLVNTTAILVFYRVRPAFHWRCFGPHGRVKEWCAVTAPIEKRINGKPALGPGAHCCNTDHFIQSQGLLYTTAILTLYRVRVWCTQLLYLSLYTESGSGAHSCHTDLIQCQGLVHTASAAHFADRVHAELWAANVQRWHAQFGRHDWSNSGAARGVIAYYKILEINIKVIFCIST